MSIEGASLQSRKLLTKAELSYRMTQLLSRNRKVLRENLDSQWDPIKESEIPTNGMLVSKYQKL